MVRFVLNKEDKEKELRATLDIVGCELYLKINDIPIFILYRSGKYLVYPLHSTGVLSEGKITDLEK